MIVLWKKHITMFLVQRKLELYSSISERVSVIEDSLTGVKAAKSGGFHVWGYVNSHNQKQLEQAEIEIFYSIKELQSLLK